MLRALTNNRADHVLACKMAEWREFANKQRQKRAAKGKWPARESVEAKDEIIVQRMSSEVTGKQQKYTRIGPGEFVPSEFYEITFDNIVEACQKYSTVQIDKDMVCDILAGERGPSCKKMCQIPYHKVERYSPLRHLLSLMCQPEAYWLSKQRILLFCGWQNLNITRLVCKQWVSLFYVRFLKMSDVEVSNDQADEEHEQEMHKVCDNT